MTDYSENGGPRAKVRADDRRGGEPGRQGQKPFEVRDGERAQVAEFAKYLTSRQIGLILRGPDEPLSKDTICRHFEDELLFGKANMMNLAGGKLLENIMANDTTSIRFFLSTQGDPGQWVERRELTGKGGGPIQTVDLADAMSKLAGLKDEDLPDLERVASILARLAGDGAAGPAPAVDPAGPDTGRDSEA